MDGLSKLGSTAGDDSKMGLDKGISTRARARSAARSNLVPAR